MRAGLVVLSDFDGTIVNIDTAAFLLDRFAQGDWRAVEQEYESGGITFEECLQKQFAMLSVPETTLLGELSHATFLRPNFAELVGFCRKESISLVVVSGGLDFSIRHFLKGLLGHVKIHAPRSKYTPSGIRVSFPKLHDESSVNFKDDLVRYYQRRGNSVIYIGDGPSDYQAARIADFAFAIKGSPLAELCRNGGLRYREMSGFQEVVEEIESWVRAFKV